MNVVYTVTPVEGENIIGYELKSQSERVGMWVANVGDEIVRKQLIALGWTPPASYQQRVGEWLVACFGETIASDKNERNFRFLEEALELVQACGCTKDEALQLVDYVYGRPVGESRQEVGGVAVTLAALCYAQGINMLGEAESELARVWTIIEKIRAKNATKMVRSPLPGKGDSA